MTQVSTKKKMQEIENESIIRMIKNAAKESESLDKKAEKQYMTEMILMTKILTKKN